MSTTASVPRFYSIFFPHGHGLKYCQKMQCVMKKFKKSKEYLRILVWNVGSVITNYGKYRHCLMYTNAELKICQHLRLHMKIIC